MANQTSKKPDLRLNVRVTDEQLTQYREAAQRCGLLLHDWSRRTLDRAAAEVTTEARTAA